MLWTNTTDIQQFSADFLQKNPEERLLILKQLGLARYTPLLTKIPYSENNIICLMGFFSDPKVVKFPKLINADLSGLILDNVNLIRGNLSGANLQNSSLIKADLLFVNLSDANLQNATLQGATLNESIWHNTIVTNCYLGDVVGLTSQQKSDLTRRGAIF
jgi:Pentapeptide repeats (8 copies)